MAQSNARRDEAAAMQLLKEKLREEKLRKKVLADAERLKKAYQDSIERSRLTEVIMGNRGDASGYKKIADLFNKDKETRYAILLK